ncbi:MAG: glycosyltransferase family 4 protein [Burkholderiaceae bacterium]|nr:glycosyltransferase family 4 protein [Burkholderiaceae bacterium]
MIESVFYGLDRTNQEHVSDGGSVIGIDATNIRSGGGLTHLVELLAAANPAAHKFQHIHVWAGSGTLARIPSRSWLTKQHHVDLDGGFAQRMWWQWKYLGASARRAGCDILLVPGGTFFGKFHPFVSISQNLLPFDWKELARYGCSRATARLLLLRFSQTLTFRRSSAIIFLSEYARNQVGRIAGLSPDSSVVIPHGIGSHICCSPRIQRSMECYSRGSPFRILYASTVSPYKHHLAVIEACSSLYSKGYPIALELVGAIEPCMQEKLARSVDASPDQGRWVKIHGEMDYGKIAFLYSVADLAVFASTCENLPIILLEKMSAGLPIACSNKAPMSDVLGSAGVYFNPEGVLTIEDAIRRLLDSPELRSRCASLGYARSRAYTWDAAAADTFSLLREIHLGLPESKSALLTGRSLSDSRRHPFSDG